LFFEKLRTYECAHCNSGDSFLIAIQAAASMVNPMRGNPPSIVPVFGPSAVFSTK
jgi:hypothetical protein